MHSSETHAEIGILAEKKRNKKQNGSQPYWVLTVCLPVCTFWKPEAQWNDALAVISVSLVMTARGARQNLSPVLGTMWNHLKSKQFEMARRDAVSPLIPGSCRSLRLSGRTSNLDFTGLGSRAAGRLINRSTVPGSQSAQTAAKANSWHVAAASNAAPAPWTASSPTELEDRTAFWRGNVPLISLQRR